MSKDLNKIVEHSFGEYEGSRWKLLTGKTEYGIAAGRVFRPVCIHAPWTHRTDLVEMAARGKMTEFGYLLSSSDIIVLEANSALTERRFNVELNQRLGLFGTSVDNQEVNITSFGSTQTVMFEEPSMIFLDKGFHKITIKTKNIKNQMILWIFLFIRRTYPIVSIGLPVHCPGFFFCYYWYRLHEDRFGINNSRFRINNSRFRINNCLFWHKFFFRCGINNFKIHCKTISLWRTF